MIRCKNSVLERREHKGTVRCANKQNQQRDVRKSAKSVRVTATTTERVTPKVRTRCTARRATANVLQWRSRPRNIHEAARRTQKVTKANSKEARQQAEAHCSTTGEIKVSTSTVAALFSKMALTGQRIAMVDMVLLVFQHFHIYCRVGCNALWVVVVHIFQFPEQEPVQTN